MGRMGREVWSEIHGELIRRPLIEGSIPGLLERAATKFGDWTALTSESGTRVSFSELADKARHFAGGLAERGVRHGDRVGLMLPNSVEYAIAFYGILMAGATVVQVNPIYVGRELEYMLASTRVETIVVGAAIATVREVREATSLRLVFVVGEETGDGEESFAVLIETSQPLSSVDIDPGRDLASIQFTGGTTGRSKGTMLTHTNLLVGLQPTFDMILPHPEELPDNGKAVAAAPFFHIFGLTMVLLAGAHYGWNLLLVPRPTPDGLIDLIARERPIYLAGVATLIGALQNHPGAADAGLDAVQLYISGGASVPEALLKAFEARTGRTLFEGYGLSEGAPVAFNNYVRGSVAGSIGIPIPGTDARIVDAETGEELGTDEPGELCIRGPQLMRGYWEMPDETADALRGGWLHTGDVALVDPHGNLRIVDRIKDMINAAGYKVYPREVEEVVYALDGVTEAAVVGVPDEYRGETVKLVVVPSEGSGLDEETILEHCRGQLAAYKVPRIIEFRDELPKSAVGKILRRELT